MGLGFQEINNEEAELCSGETRAWRLRVWLAKAETRATLGTVPPSSPFRLLILPHKGFLECPQSSLLPPSSWPPEF